jgi:hypothetical protein
MNTAIVREGCSGLSPLINFNSGGLEMMIGQLNHDQPRRAEPRLAGQSLDILFPLPSQPRFFLFVVVGVELRQVHGVDLRREAQRRGESLIRQAVSALDRDQHDWRS